MSKTTLKDRAENLKDKIPALFLSLKDAETPPFAKLLAGITVAYALSPIDLIPDFIPLLGYLDDLILLPVLIVLTIRLIPSAVWEKNLVLAKDMQKEKAHKKWF